MNRPFVSHPCRLPGGRARRLSRFGEAAFTLVELLTVIAIVGVLAAILIPSYGAVKRNARMTKELSAAKQVALAYLMTPQDNRGRLFPSTATDADQVVTYNEMGELLPHTTPTAKRWPNRLRPYLGDRFRETLFVNDQVDYYDEMVQKNDYLGTTQSSFGLNWNYVGGGGGVTGSTVLSTEPPVSRVADAANPSKLIAFVGATDAETHVKSGFWRVDSPAGWVQNGAPKNDEAALTKYYGFVAFRHSGKAVVAFLDGHAELLDYAALRDMRLWSNAAYLENNPNYRPGYVE